MSETIYKLSYSELGKRGGAAYAKTAKKEKQKRIAEYEKNPSKCSNCDNPMPYKKRHNKFCGSSCSASFNNKGVRRHGKDPNKCIVCETETRNEKYCSVSCFGKDNTIYTEEERKLLNREAFMRYYTRKKNQTPEDADFDKIKEIYLNCPEGHEVDHIIPISKGGLHHQDNLQYLTVSENRRKGNKLNW